jgi:hypothetical protein
MLALLAQLFAFHAAWGSPPPAYHPPPPAMISAERATWDALYYCRERGLACRPDGARLLRGDVWRVFLDVKRKHHYRGRMVLDVDAWSGAVLAAFDRPRADWRWKRW